MTRPSKRPSARPSTRRRLAALAALALLFAGCGDDPEPKMPPSSDPSPSTTTTPSRTADAAVEPTLPPEAKGNDEAAAEAFIRYYWSLANYVQATGHVKAFREVALPSCVTCSRSADYFERSYRKGGYLRGGEYSITRVKVDPGAEGAGVRSFVAEVSLTSAPSTERATASASPIEHDATNQSIVMSLLSSGSGFKVASWEGK
ncbi:DUF6318 family protein [Nocardioides sp. LHG3406-4]|uniref:DUF6318 family protein n=1 Tax=Nocardioides sp. LHG3406-4 TaxID=2804575 RepID=UPI003CEC13C8